MELNILISEEDVLDVNWITSLLLTLLRLMFYSCEVMFSSVIISCAEIGSSSSCTTEGFLQPLDDIRTAKHFVLLLRVISKWRLTHILRSVSLSWTELNIPISLEDYLILVNKTVNYLNAVK